MYRLANELLHPYTLLLLIMAVVMVKLWRRPSESRRRLLCITLPFLLLILISTPAVSHLAFATLEHRFTPLVELPSDTDAIVVLAGWVLPRNANRPNPILADDSLYRCLHAAELYRRSGPCLIVLSGGTVNPAEDSMPVADAMRDFLLQLGIASKDLLVENRSTTTYENAVECHKLVQERQLQHVVLVTEADHMARAVACFRKTGLRVTPAPCQFVTGQFELRLSTFLPSPGAARGTEKVFHEWLGLAWYWFQGRI
jgi:uncharacterized SAM-binding protein YcdF (DUF218 family)